MEGLERILDRFVEGLFRQMLEHHQKHAMEMDMTLPQAQALRLLRAAPVSTSGLAGALGISAPAVTQLTDRLFRKHLIERRAVEADRRSVMVALTDKGKRVVDRFRQRRNEVFAEALLRLSDKDRAEVIRALRKVAAVLDGYETQQLKDLQDTEAFGLPEQTERQTAVEASEASKKVGRAPVGRPSRRMKIEWD